MYNHLILEAPLDFEHSALDLGSSSQSADSSGNTAYHSCPIPSSSRAYVLARAYNLLVYGSSSGIIADAFLSVYDAHNISSDEVRPGSRDDFSGRFISQLFKRSLEERGIGIFFDNVNNNVGLKTIVDAAIADVMPKQSEVFV